jgi:DnaK suppressor protein
MAPGEPTDAARRAQRALLTAERTRAERRLAALEQTFEEMVAAADLEPPDDEHDPEGTTAYERAQVSSLAEATRAGLHDLGLALAALDHGDYGWCARCGEAIDPERLEALPDTRVCVTCAAGPTARR